MGVPPAGPPNATIVGVADPAAGADFVFSSVANTLYVLHSIHAAFQADGNASNRYFTIVIDDGTSPFLIIPITQKIVAGELWDLSWANFGHTTLDATNNYTNVMFPAPYPLPKTFRIISTVIGIQVGDQIGNLFLLFSTWHKP